MNHSKRLASLVAVVGLVAAACGGGATGTPAASTAASQPAGTQAASTAPTLTGTLTIWQSYASGGGELTAFNQVLDKVKAANPGLTINNVTQDFSKMFQLWDTDVLAGGASADMFIAPNDNLYSEAAAHTILNLNDKLTAAMLTGFSQTAVNGAKADIGDGKGPQFYMVPESLKAVALWYDKSKIATPPATTADLLAGVTSGAIKLGLNQNAYHMFGFSGSFGGKLMDDTGKCIADQAGFADAFKYMEDLKAAGAKYYTNGANITPDLHNGVINAVIDGPWQTADFTSTDKGIGANAAVAAMPAGPGGKANPFTGTDGWYINPNSQNVDLAFQFALQMVATAQEQIMTDGAGHVPAAPNVTISSSIVKGFADAAANGLPRPQTKAFGNYWGPFGNAINSLVQKNSDPTQTVKDACSQMNAATFKQS
ncbi:MAG TPA: extracellular solute-binding protein [Candidatus Limnocylindrales bacterium]|nr:extracellular solute-binding protein [Candidatus Limnocylindrales bacterium]